jgi:hypothetical protein
MHQLLLLLAAHPPQQRQQQRVPAAMATCLGASQWSQQQHRQHPAMLPLLLPQLLLQLPLPPTSRLRPLMNCLQDSQPAQPPPQVAALQAA